MPIDDLAFQLDGGTSANVLAVSTRHGVDRILADGGVSNLFLDRRKSVSCEFAICVRSRRTEPFVRSELPGSAFLLGRISEVVPWPGAKRRVILKFGAFARLTVPDFRKGWKNPVRYIPFQDVEEIIAAAQFEAMPRTLSVTPAPASANSAAAQRNPPPPSIEVAIAERLRATEQLTIQAAKEALARSFGVLPEQIEIIIKA